MLTFLSVLAVLVRLFGNDEHFIFVGITALMPTLTLQLEREFIKQRQREGIEVARANGVHLGRKAMDRPNNYAEVRLAWENGEISGRAAAKMLGISHTAFRNWVHSG